MTKPLNSTAQRAKDLAREKRDEEIRVLKLAVGARDKRIEMLNEGALGRCSDIDKLNARLIRVSTYRTAFFIMLVIATTAFVFSFAALMSVPVPTDASYKPPALQKIKVITYGFMDQKGVYRSYATGEPLDPQPIQWTTP